MCGVFEAITIVAEDSPDESPDESMAEMDSDNSKLAKDTANEKRAAEDGAVSKAEDMPDPWLPLGMAMKHKKFADNGKDLAHSHSQGQIGTYLPIQVPVAKDKNPPAYLWMYDYT